ncbi:MAG: FAD-binding oxidoreductase [Micrococcales bacterium]|nr:FAD-binding oxidoreductase [Micrococcales bacterium]
MASTRHTRGSTVFERQSPPSALVDTALDGSRLEVFWLSDVERPQFPRLTAGVDCDLAVVGGGYAGLWTAVLAKRRDPSLRVVLLEADRVGWAASGRNGGFAEASLTHGEDNGRSRWPHEMAELERIGQDNLDGLVRDLDELDIDAHVERSGMLSVAVERYQARELEERREELGAAYLSAEQVRARVDSPTYLGAEADSEGCALVHPARLAIGLARAADRLGVEIHEGMRVTALRPTGGWRDPVQVVSGDVIVRARKVALATNVFPALLPQNSRMTIPVYDYALMTEPLTDEQLGRVGWTGREGISDRANQFHYYRLSRDNRILFGGYDAVYRPDVDPRHEDNWATYRRLAAHFLTTFPQLEDVRFSHRWAGAIDTCTRFCAFHGVTAQRRVAYTAGYTGLGVGATRFGARVMLDLLDGRQTELTELEMVRQRPMAFPPGPLATLGIEATRWSIDQADHAEGRRNLLLRSLDRLGLGFDS